MSQSLLQVLDMQYQPLAILNDNSLDIAHNITLDRKLNAVDTLTFELPMTSSKWQYIINENLIKWEDEYYIIKNPNFAHSKDKKIITVECEHLSTTLGSKIKQVLDLIGVTANDMMTEILQDTGWTVGNVQVENKYRSLQSTDTSAFTALVSVAEKYNAMLIFNSAARTVDLLSDYTDRGLSIRKRKNLKSLNLNYDTKSIVTRLYVYGGQDDTGNQISIVGVNPTGQSYIENYSFYLNKGIPQTYIDSHPELFRNEQTWNASDYIDEQLLYDDAVAKLNSICNPIMTCSLSAADLSMFPEEFIDSPELGETIYVYDEDFNLSLRAKIDNIRKNYDNPLDLQITISNILEYTSIFNQLVDSSQKTSKVISPLTQIYGQYIKEATIDDAHIKNLNAEKINAGDIDTDRMKANVINAVNSYTGTAQIDTAKIKQIIAGDTVIGKAAIGDAQISDLSADKLNAGTVNTAVVTVQGTNGRLKILGNRLQVFDENAQNVLFERVALGDVNADGSIYGFRVRGADGTTLLIDENGVHGEGITNGAITNPKIANNANIDGSKLNIQSVITAINNGTTTINSSKVYMDDTTLDVAFSQIQQTQLDQGVDIQNNSSQISVMSDQISLKASQTDLDKVNDTLTQYDTKFTTLNTDVDGVKIDVNDIKTKVDGNQTEIDNINTYFEFDTSGMTIGKNDSPLNITISNSEMDFIDSGNIIAYVNGQKMYISSLEVLSSLIVGVHKIEKYNDEITLVKWVGGGAS